MPEREEFRLAGEEGTHSFCLPLSVCFRQNAPACEPPSECCFAPEECKRHFCGCRRDVGPPGDNPTSESHRAVESRQLAGSMQSVGDGPHPGRRSRVLSHIILLALLRRTLLPRSLSPLSCFETPLLNASEYLHTHSGLDPRATADDFPDASFVAVGLSFGQRESVVYKYSRRWKWRLALREASAVQD